ncbi:MAG: glutamyl-tRNA reductase [Gammaproteobacteria bacterium]|nr:glutamyl-tRNA reductase [Gammaproteobacteria bacterium]
MYLTVLGINHRTAPVEVRGQVAFPPDQIARALAELIALDGMREAAILSTCNRTEVYCTLDDASPEVIANWLARFHQLDQDSLQPHLYSYQEAEAVRHILRVAAGLDSMILGEPQILGQMKDAYQQSLQANSIDTLVNRLFQHTFSVAKQVRTDTAIGASPVSVAFAAVSLARQIFGKLENQTALLVGAGETIELTARHLHEQGIGKIIIANRTVTRAHELASQFNGYGIGLDEITAHLEEADIVISSTGSTEPLITRDQVRAALKKRKHRPVFMVDIAVPQDIAADVAELDDIYLYTVDDLKQVIEENLRSREEAALQAEEIIDSQVERFMAWVHSLDAVPTVRAYRAYAESLGDAEIEKAGRQLENGTPPQEVIKTLTRNLVKKLSHNPSVNLRNAAADGKAGLLEAVRILFQLNTRDKK